MPRTCTLSEAVDSLHDLLIMVNDDNADTTERAHARRDLQVVSEAITAALDGDADKVSRMLSIR